MTTQLPFGDSDDFEDMYRLTDNAHGLPAATPWDIGCAQAAVRRLVSLGAIRGTVLDPGTGPGHNAIYLASQGYSTIGIDSSETAIERARENADKAGVEVDFRVADATKLDGFEGQFDTVVDSAFYHLFYGHAELQKSYLNALHTATKRDARLYMFEFGSHNVNGYTMPHADSELLYRELLSNAGWNITYFEPTTYQQNLDITVLEKVATLKPEIGAALGPMLERFRTIGSWLTDGRAHAPIWEVHATRIN